MRQLGQVWVPLGLVSFCSLVQQVCCQNLQHLPSIKQHAVTLLKGDSQNAVSFPVQERGQDTFGMQLQTLHLLLHCLCSSVLFLVLGE